MTEPESKTFTVTLPRYDYTGTFDYDRFLHRYPNSLIALALQSGENVIELENPRVTPQVLRLLSTVLDTDHYPYISDPTVKVALDYLDEPTLVGFV